MWGVGRSREEGRQKEGRQEVHATYEPKHHFLLQDVLSRKKLQTGREGCRREGWSDIETVRVKFKSFQA